MDQVQFTEQCMLHAMAGAGLGVVIDSACNRLFKRLAKTTLHDHLARVVMILFQLMLFVGVAVMEIVYSPGSGSNRQETVCTLFFEMMVFLTQSSFFERIQTLTKDV
jgi:preprotein translocase subunit SecG